MGSDSSNGGLDLTRLQRSLTRLKGLCLFFMAMSVGGWIIGYRIPPRMISAGEIENAREGLRRVDEKLDPDSSRSKEERAWLDDKPVGGELI